MANSASKAGAAPRARGAEPRRRWIGRPPRSLRPTRAGWCFFAITFGVAFAALNTGNNLLYVVLSLMLAFLALSGFLSELALRGVHVERRLPHELFAGAGNRVPLVLENRKARGSAYALHIEDLLAREPSPRRRRRGERRVAGHAFALRIEPGARHHTAYSWAPERRGFTELEEFRLSTRFPFGLFVKSRTLPSPARVLVYPAVETISDRGQPDRAHESGSAANGPGHDGAQVSGLREFASGDPGRRIVWRRSLRRGVLLVGEIEDESEAEVEVLLRTGIETPADDPEREQAMRARFEERVRLAASEVVHHTELGRRVGLRTDSERIAPQSGRAHRARLLAFLATVEPGEPAAPPELAAPAPFGAEA